MTLTIKKHEALGIVTVTVGSRSKKQYVTVVYLSDGREIWSEVSYHRATKTGNWKQYCYDILCRKLIRCGVTREEIDRYVASISDAKPRPLKRKAT